MKYVPAIAIAAALAFTASAHGASNYQKRQARYKPAPVVVVPAARPVGPSAPYGCYQSESAGRRTACGQGS